MVLLPLHFVAQTPNDEACGTEISGDPDPAGVYSYSDNYILDTEESSMGIDVSGLPTGLYSVILVCNGEIQSVKNLVKQ